MAFKLDSRDQKILAELDRNARQSNSQIGKKVGISKETVKYRIDRLKERGIIIRFHTITNYFKLGVMKFKLYMRLTNATKKQREEIATYFKDHPKTEWVVLTTGRWDIIIGFMLHNINEFDDELQTFLKKYADKVLDRTITMTLELVYRERGFLGKRKDAMLGLTTYTSRDEQAMIDGTDREILRLMTNNARLPSTEIAKQIGTTARIVQYRIKELEKKRIILAYKVHLEPKAMGRIFCKAILSLNNTTKERLDQFVSYASSVPGAVWPQRVLGSWDFELDLELESYDAFQDVVADLMERFPDLIQAHDFIIVSKEFKLDFFPEAYPQI